MTMTTPTRTALPLQKSFQKSLQKQLLVWILGTLLSIGILVQIAVFCYTYQEFNTSQKTATLRMTVLLIGKVAIWHSIMAE
jgi:two-component system OmpR family sensor kinase